MKSTFTLIVVCLIAVSLMGQIAKRNHQENKFHNGFNLNKYSLNKYQTKSPDNYKSTQVIKYQMDSAIYEDYDESISEWIIDAKEDCLYDENLNMVQSTWSYWEEDQWDAVDRYEYTYDEDGLIILYVANYWQESTSQWVVNYKEEYTYNTNGDLALEIFTNWDVGTSQWELGNKKEYTYDNDWKLISIIEYNWEDDINEWVNGDKEEYTYDNNGYLLLMIKHEWDNDINEWKLNEKKEYTCDTNGNVTSIITYYMNNNTNEWSIYKKSDYTYGANENPIKDILSYWDATLNDWLEDNKYEFTYDLNYDLSDLILPPPLNYYPDFSGNITNMPVDFLRYAYTNEEWFMNLRGTYYYSEQIVTGVADIPKTAVQVFPNPASEFITIRFGEELQQISFNLIDIQGRKIIQQVISNHEQVMVKQLPKGLYFYILNDNNQTLQAGKIVVE